MQPLAAKLPRNQRTSFSVEDILDPTKFTRRKICEKEAGESNFLRTKKQYVPAPGEICGRLPLDTDINLFLMLLFFSNFSQR